VTSPHHHLAAGMGGIVEYMSAKQEYARLTREWGEEHTRANDQSTASASIPGSEGKAACGSA
jgi:hypothetical protein